MSNLRVAELDYDQIKQNLKDFFKSQNYFTDYEFEGSALSILIDQLAYNTHYNAMYANMMVNERFIDTAVKRASVVSHAKALGYVPMSVRASKAVCDVTVYGDSPTGVMYLERFTPFKTSILGTSYTLVTTKSYSATPSGDFATYKFSGVELYEGTPLTYQWVVSDPLATFKIPSLTADTSTLQVVVQESTTSSAQTVFSLASAASTLDGSSPVYFLQEGTDGYFYVYFGDGVLGKQVAVGNVISLTYISTTGASANLSAGYSQSITLDGTIGDYGSSNVIVDVLVPSNGGADRDSIDTIRYRAPKNFAAQSSLCTSNDYAVLLPQQFPEIDSIKVWGGEENVPPKYGSVIMAIKPTNGYVMPAITKAGIIDWINGKSVVGLTPVIVDPDFIFVSMNCTVKYNTNVSTLDIATLRSNVTDAINMFFKNTLSKFDKTFYYSKIGAIIDSLDSSILGNDMTISLQKRIEPLFSISNSYTLNYSNQLTPYSVSSSYFNVKDLKGNVITVSIKDFPLTVNPNNATTGDLKLVNVVDSSVVSAIGTINYTSGILQLNGLVVTSYPSTSLVDIRINATPAGVVRDLSVNVLSQSTNTATQGASVTGNQILLLDDSVAVPKYGVSAGLTVIVTPINT